MSNTLTLLPGHVPLSQWRQIYRGASVQLDASAQAAVLRSAQVVAFLMQRGLEDVYNLEGGTDAWARQVAPDMPRY